MSTTSSWYLALVAARLLVAPQLASCDACSATPYPLSRISQDTAFVSTPFLPRLFRRTRAAAQANSGGTSPVQMMTVVADGDSNGEWACMLVRTLVGVKMRWVATAHEHERVQLATAAVLRDAKLVRLLSHCCLCDLSCVTRVRHGTYGASFHF